MILVGIDDTDVLGSPGTNKLARVIIGALGPEFYCHVAVRHQLLFDPRIPYTSKNSSASLLIEPRDGGTVGGLIERIRQIMRGWFVEGSDPGLCVAQAAPEEITQFGQTCQREIVSQDDARALAARHGIHLEGLGGTEGGVIGALAAVGLLAGGDDGRVVNIGHWPDDLAGPQEIDLLHKRGVAEVRCVDSGKLIEAGRMDIGKHLRPNYRGGRVVLFVEPLCDERVEGAPWKAVRLL